MTTTPPTATDGHDDRDGRPAWFPIARLDLQEEIRRMRTSPRHGDHLAKTLLRSADVRLVLMILQRGARLPDHRTDGSLVIQTVDGRVIVTLLESIFELGPGQLLAIEHDVTHGLVAVDDSAILLTIAWRGHRSPDRESTALDTSPVK